MKQKNNSEENVLKLAIQALENSKLLKCQIAKLQCCPPVDKDYRIDSTIELDINGIKLKYHVEIKETLTKAGKLLMLMNIQNLNYPVMLITKYVNPEMAEELKNDGVEFADTVGNIFINQHPVLIFVKGNKYKDREIISTKRAFKNVGLKMIFAFLANPGLENAVYREIADITGVALGSVGWIMKELRELGFLCKRSRGSFLTNKETLLQRWLQAYPEQLRPKLLLGNYSGIGEWWLQGKINPPDSMWGGEIAAQRMTNYLKPQMLTIYTKKQNLNKLLIENRLRKDQEGNVEILEKFWEFEEKNLSENLVHPLLVYADLIASGRQRNLETAKIIYEQHIIRLIGEN